MPENLIPAGFAQGLVSYWDYEPTQQHSRIVIPVSFGNVATTAILDTGSPWCVLSPDEAFATGFDYQVSAVEYPTFYIRGYPYRGWLCSGIPITIEASRGSNINIGATVFVPELALGQEWRWPNFVGLSGFLERIRFAIDPSTHSFYFGVIE